MTTPTGGYTSFNIHGFFDQEFSGIPPDVRQAMEDTVSDLINSLRNTGVDIQRKVEAAATQTFTASQLRDTLGTYDTQISNIVNQIKNALHERFAGKVTPDKIDEFADHLQAALPEISQAQQAMSQLEQKKKTTIFDLAGTDRKQQVQVHVAEQMLVSTMALQLKATPPNILGPQDYFDSITNPFGNPDDFNFTDLDGNKPNTIPMNNWWSFLGSRMAAGNSLIHVIPDDQAIQFHPPNPLYWITESQYAEFYKGLSQYNPNLPPPNSTTLKQKPVHPSKIDDYPSVILPRSLAFNPNINMGTWMIKNNEHGIQFAAADEYAWLTGDTSVYQSMNLPTMVAGASQDFSFNPRVIAHGDLSAELYYETLAHDGSMTAYETQGDPYQTLVYSGHVTPMINIEGAGGVNVPDGWDIDLSTIHGYSYDASGNLQPNADGPPWKGQVITFSTKGNPATGAKPQMYRIYLSQESYFKPNGYTERTILPDDVYNQLDASDPVQAKFLYISESEAAKYSNDPSHLHPYGTVMVPMTDDEMQKQGKDGKTRGLVMCNADGSDMTEGVGQSLTMRIARVPPPGPPPLPASTVTSDYLNSIYNQAQSTLAELKKGANTDDIKLFDMLVKVLDGLIHQKPTPQSPTAIMSQVQNWAESVTGDLTKLSINFPKVSHGAGSALDKFLQLTGISPSIATMTDNIQKNFLDKYPPDSPTYKLFSDLLKLLNPTSPRAEPYMLTTAEIASWAESVLNAKTQYVDAEGHGPDPSVWQAFAAMTGASQASIDILDRHATTIVISATAQVTGNGTYSYQYVTRHMNMDNSGLTPDNAPGALVGLLSTDSRVLQNPTSSPLFYNSINGPVSEFEIPKNNTLDFQRKPLGTDPFDGMDIPTGTTPQDIQNIQKIILDLIDDANKATIPTQGQLSGSAMYDWGMMTQKTAQLALYLYYLEQKAPSEAFTPAIRAAAESARLHALSVAEKSLAAILESGAFVYDSTFGGMITRNGAYNRGADYSNSLYVDHHFMTGYVLGAAWMIKYMDSNWFTADRIDRVNCLVQDICNIDGNPNFPQSPRNLDWFSGHSWAQGALDATGSGSNEESSAEDVNFWSNLAHWGHEINNTTMENIGATVGATVATASQTYWQVGSQANTGIYLPGGFNPDGSPIDVVGNIWSISQTTGTFFTPAQIQYPEIYAAGIQSIGTLPSLTNAVLDPEWAKKIFSDLIDLDDFANSPIFQNRDILNNKALGNSVSGLATFMTILIPLIAKVSPIAALKILDWYKKANAIDPGNYSWHNSSTFGSLEFAIMSQKSSVKNDPAAGKDLKLPPLPLPTVPPTGTGIPSQIQLVYQQAAEFSLDHPSDIMNLLKNQISSMGAGATMIDLQKWAQQIVDSKKYPVNDDLRQFCALTGAVLPSSPPMNSSDIEDALHAWQDEIKAQGPVPNYMYNLLQSFIDQLHESLDAKRPLSDFLQTFNNHLNGTPHFYSTLYDSATHTTISPSDLVRLCGIFGFSPLPPTPSAIDTALFSAIKYYKQATTDVAKKFYNDLISKLQGQPNFAVAQDFIKDLVKNHFSQYPGLNPADQIIGTSLCQFYQTSNPFNYANATDFNSFIAQMTQQAENWDATLDKASTAHALVQKLLDILHATPPPADFSTLNALIDDKLFNNQGDIFTSWPGISIAEATVFTNLIEPDGHFAPTGDPNRQLGGQLFSAQQIDETYQKNYMYLKNLQAVYEQQVLSAIDQANKLFFTPGTTIFSLKLSGETTTLWEKYFSSLKPPIPAPPTPPPYPDNAAGWKNIANFLKNFLDSLEDVTRGTHIPRSQAEWIMAAQKWGLLDPKIDPNNPPQPDPPNPKIDYLQLTSKALNGLDQSLVPLGVPTGYINVYFADESSAANIFVRMRDSEQGVNLQNEVVEHLAKMNQEGANFQDFYNWAQSVDLTQFGSNTSHLETPIQDLQTLIRNYFPSLFSLWNDGNFNVNAGNPYFPMPVPGSFSPLSSPSDKAILNNLSAYFQRCHDQLATLISQQNWSQVAKDFGLPLDANISTAANNLLNQFQNGIALIADTEKALTSVPPYLQDFFQQTGISSFTMNSHGPLGPLLTETQQALQKWPTGPEHDAFEAIIQQLLFLNQFNLSTDDLKRWGSTILKNYPDILNMNPEALAEFRKITGAELPPSPPPLDSYIHQIKDWESHFSPTSPTRTFIDTVILPALTNNDTLAKALEEIKTKLPPNAPYDIFILCPDMSLDPANDQYAAFLKIFDNQFPPQTLLNADKLYRAAWADLAAYPDDAALFQTVLDAVKKVGSTDDLTKIRADLQTNVVNNKQSVYYTASQKAVQEFNAITGITPPSGEKTIDDYINALQQWINDPNHKSNTAGLKFAHALLDKFQAGKQNQLTVDAVIAQIKAMYKQPIGDGNTIDLYLQFSGIDAATVHEISQDIFNGKLPDLDPPTEMDQLFAQIQKERDALTAAADKTLIGELLTAITNSIGSNGTQADITSFANKFLRGPAAGEFTSATPAGKQAFLDITKATPNYAANMIANITTWLNTPPNKFDANTPQYKFAQAILGELGKIQDQVLDIEQIVADINSQVINKLSQNKDIYLQFLGLTKSNIDSLNQFLAANLDPSAQFQSPQPSTIDSRYLELNNWYATAHGNAQDGPLADDLKKEFDDYISSWGSSDAHLQDITDWARNHELTNANFSRASSSAQAMFTHLTGVSGTDRYIQRLEDWLRDNHIDEKTQPQVYQFIQDLEAEFRSGEQSGSSFAAIRDKIINDMLDGYKGSQDIYLRYFGLQDSQVKDLFTNYINDPSTNSTLPVPAMTDMDKLFVQLDQLEKHPPAGFTSNDLALISQMQAQIYKYGSANSASFYAWAKQLIDNDNSLFTSASDAFQTQFAELTHTNITGHYIDRLTEWENGLAPNQSGVRNFIDSIITQLRILQTTSSVGDIINAIKSKVFVMYGDFKNQSIFMHFAGLEPGDLKKLSALFSTSQRPFDVPEPSKIDTMFIQAFNWLNLAGHTMADYNLITDLKKKLEELGSNDTNLSILNDWIKNTVMNPQSTDPAAQDWKGATTEGITKFESITGTTPNVVYSLIQNIKAWQDTLGVNTPQYHLAQAILDQLNGLVGKTPEPTMDDICKLIQNNVFVQGNKDIYMIFPGLRPNDITTLSRNFFNGQLAPPSVTAMDQIFFNAQDWQANASAPISNVATNLINEILGLGSNGNLKDLKDWANHLIDTSDDFEAAPADQKEDFATLTGGEPLHRNIAALTNWLNSLKPPTQAESNVVAFLIAKLQGYEGKTPPQLFDAKIQQDLQNALFSTGNFKDVYLQFPGITENDMKNICGILSDKGLQTNVAFTPMTDLDKIYTNLIAKGGNGLLHELTNRILNVYGSHNYKDMQTWAQNLIDTDNTLFTDSTSDVQSFFAEQTGTDILQHYFDRLRALDDLFSKSSITSGAQQLGANLESVIQGLKNKQPPPKTLSDLSEALDKYLFEVRDGQDIFLRFAGLSDSQLRNFQQIFSTQSKSLPLPQRTPIDRMAYQAYVWLNSGLTGKDLTLARSLWQKLYPDMKSTDSVPDLRAWAKELMKTSTFTEASPTAQNQFDAIVGLNYTPVYNVLENVKAWRDHHLPETSPQYQMADQIIKELEALENKDPPPTMEDLCSAINKDIFHKGNNDVYLIFSGVSPDDIFSLSQAAFNNQLTPPAVTPIDQTYMNALKWQQQTPASTLAGSLIKEILSLGSTGDINDLKKWSYGIIDTDDSFASAPASEKTSFATITGTEPLHRNITLLNNWLASLKPPTQAETNLVAFLVSRLQSMEGRTPPQLFDSKVQQDLQSALFSTSNLKDVYLQFPGIKETDMKTITGLLNDKGLQTSVAFSPMTDMDTLYNTLLTKGGNGLLGELRDSILNTYGSFNWKGMQTWAQNLIDSDGSLFTNSTSDIQSYFADQTKTDILQHYIDRLAKLVNGWGTGVFGSGASKLGSDIQALIANLKKSQPPAKTLSDLLQGINSTIFTMKDGKDIYIQYPGLSDDQMTALKNAFSTQTTPMTVPSRNSMDTIFYNAYVWVNSGITGKDGDLVKALWQRVQNAKSTDDYKALQAWGEDFKKTSTFTGANWSVQQKFCDLLGIPRPTTGLDDIYQTMLAYFNDISNRYKADLKALNPYFKKWGVPKTSTEWDTMAKLIYDDGVAKNNQYIKDLGNITLREAQRFSSAVPLFQSVITEIQRLKDAGKSVNDLNAWAQSLLPLSNNYPNLDPQDLAEFQQLLLPG